MPKNPRVRTLIDGHILQGPKDRLNLLGIIFDVFFDHSEGKSAGKVLF